MCGAYTGEHDESLDEIFGKKELVVKEPQNPEEGEFSLDSYGELVQYKNGRWQRP